MYRRICIALAALVAGVAAAQEARRPDPAEPKAKVPPTEYRSAFEGYRPFADEERRDWRKSNEEVGAAGGHAGSKPGQQTSKPQPGKPETSGGHGGHK
jgi:hypothetical protein